jgi:hypothetical protein
MLVLDLDEIHFRIPVEFLVLNHSRLSGLIIWAKMKEEPSWNISLGLAAQQREDLIAFIHVKYPSRVRGERLGSTIIPLL